MQQRQHIIASSIEPAAVLNRNMRLYRVVQKLSYYN